MAAAGGEANFSRKLYNKVFKSESLKQLFLSYVGKTQEDAMLGWSNTGVMMSGYANPRLFSFFKTKLVPYRYSTLATKMLASFLITFDTFNRPKLYEGEIDFVSDVIGFLLNDMDPFNKENKMTRNLVMFLKNGIPDNDIETTDWFLNTPMLYQLKKDGSKPPNTLYRLSVTNGTRSAKAKVKKLLIALGFPIKQDFFWIPETLKTVVEGTDIVDKLQAPDEYLTQDKLKERLKRLEAALNTDFDFQEARKTIGTMRENLTDASLNIILQSRFGKEVSTVLFNTRLRWTMKTDNRILDALFDDTDENFEKHLQQFTKSVQEVAGLSDIRRVFNVVGVNKNYMTDKEYQVLEPVAKAIPTVHATMDVNPDTLSDRLLRFIKTHIENNEDIEEALSAKLRFRMLRLSARTADWCKNTLGSRIVKVYLAMMFCRFDETLYTANNDAVSQSIDALFEGKSYDVNAFPIFKEMSDSANDGGSDSDSDSATEQTLVEPGGNSETGGSPGSGGSAAGEGGGEDTAPSPPAEAVDTPSATGTAPSPPAEAVDPATEEPPAATEEPPFVGCTKEELEELINKTNTGDYDGTELKQYLANIVDHYFGLSASDSMLASKYITSLQEFENYVPKLPDSVPVKCLLRFIQHAKSKKSDKSLNLCLAALYYLFGISINTRFFMEIESGDIEKKLGLELKKNITFVDHFWTLVNKDTGVARVVGGQLRQDIGEVRIICENRRSVEKNVKPISNASWFVLNYPESPLTEVVQYLIVQNNVLLWCDYGIARWKEYVMGNPTFNKLPRVKLQMFCSVMFSASDFSELQYFHNIASELVKGLESGEGGVAPSALPSAGGGAGAGADSTSSDSDFSDSEGEEPPPGPMDPGWGNIGVAASMRVRSRFEDFEQRRRMVSASSRSRVAVFGSRRTFSGSGSGSSSDSDSDLASEDGACHCPQAAETMDARNADFRKALQALGLGHGLGVGVGVGAGVSRASARSKKARTKARSKARSQARARARARAQRPA